jgi:flagellar biogenesis protein FliO
MKIKMLFSAFLMGSSMASLAQSQPSYVIPPMAFPQKDLKAPENTSGSQIYSPEHTSHEDTEEFYKLKSEIENIKAQEAQPPNLGQITTSEANVVPLAEAPSQIKVKENKEANEVKEIKEPQSDLFQNGIMGVVGFLTLIGMGGYILVRIKRRGILNTLPEKSLFISSSISLSPKRQILVLQVNNREILIANTEAGIQFLSDLGSTSGIATAGSIKNLNTTLEQRPSQIASALKTNIVSSAAISTIEQTKGEGEEHLHKKSDILLKALKKLNHNQDDAPKADETHKSAFPKYAFEQESKKEIKKDEDSSESVESVTNLIREKLRSMKPLN